MHRDDVAKPEMGCPMWVGQTLTIVGQSSTSQFSEWPSPGSHTRLELLHMILAAVAMLQVAFTRPAV
jgi:hypothetical protein